MKEFPFTDEELQKLQEDSKPSELWKKAFDYYASAPGNNRLSLGCRSCYSKVLIYVMKNKKHGS